MPRYASRYVTLILFFIIGLFAGTATAQEQKKEPENAAIVNGQPIAYKDYALELNLLQRRMQAQGQQIPQEYMSKVKTELLKDLVNRELLYQDSQKKGIQIKKQDVEKEIASLKGRYSDPKQYEAILKNMNMTEDQLKKQFARRASIRTLIDQEITSNIEVTEKAAKDFYDSNPGYFEHPEQVRASHILIKVASDASDQEKAQARKKIKNIKKKIDAGEDFSEMAKKHSEGPSNVRGGDLGYFSKGKMVPPFEQKAFSMKKNEVSDIVETQFGYHLIKVLDHKDAGKAGFEEVDDKIKANLRNQQIQQKLVAYLDELRRNAKIETFVD